MPPRATFVLVVLGAATLLAFLFRDQLQTLNQGDLSAIIYMVLVLILVGGGYFGMRANFRQHALRNAFIWIVVFFGLTMALTLLPPEMTYKYQGSGW